MLTTQTSRGDVAQHGKQSPGIPSFAIAPQHPTNPRGPLDLMTAMPGNGFDILVTSRRSI
jgi:hypothetical protein